MAGCGSEEVLQRAALTSTSRACSRSASALTSRPAPSSSDDVHASHAPFGAFALMNSHLSTSSKRAKRSGFSLSASLPHTHERLISRCRLVERTAGDLLLELHNRHRGSEAI